MSTPAPSYDESVIDRILAELAAAQDPSGDPVGDADAIVLTADPASGTLTIGTDTVDTQRRAYTSAFIARMWARIRALIATLTPSAGS